jgi:uncharacterized protein YjbJ (UPF0337 family)
MVRNDDILEDRWPELQSHLKERWSKLSDADIAKLSGKQDELVVALGARYGYAQAQAVMEIQSWISDFDSDAARVSNDDRKD